MLFTIVDLTVPGDLKAYVREVTYTILDIKVGNKNQSNGNVAEEFQPCGTCPKRKAASFW